MNASMLLIKTEERGLHRNCRRQRDSARRVES
jgi:hypothetical protein